MESEPYGAASQRDEDEAVPRLGWAASLTLGVITVILGVIIAFRPAQTLAVIAVLLGVVMLVSGIYHIVRALDGREHDRVWRGVSGVLCLLAGLVLIRHLHLSIALIGMFIGFTWIIQGVASLMEGFSRGRGRGEKGWSVFFGIVSLIAGIVVISAPIASLGALTIFMGAWFIVMGAFEVLGALVTRRSRGSQAPGSVSGVPQQRSSTPAREGVTPEGDPARQGTGAGGGAR
jgi:uncharacterized membrane protein HdeD (DUF308 family)